VGSQNEWAGFKQKIQKQSISNKTTSKIKICHRWGAGAHKYRERVKNSNMASKISSTIVLMKTLEVISHTHIQKTS